MLTSLGLNNNPPTIDLKNKNDMKTINNYLLALLGVFVLSWTACTDNVDYEPASSLEGQGAYFAAASASFTVEEASGTQVLQVYRSNKSGGTDIPLTITYEEGVESAVQVPATAKFADGETVANVNISYNNLTEGKAYKLNIAVADATPYASPNINVSFLYSNEPVYTWEVVSEEAIYLDDMFNLIGAGGMKTTGITVEKAKEINWYRFHSPYDNAYFTATWGGNLFPAGFEFNYIVLDGETYKDATGEPLYYIKKTNLGFRMVVSGNNANIDVDTETLMFGSVAGNLSAGGEPIPPTSTTYPLGTYDKKKKIFELGAVFQNIDGYGMNVYPAGKFKLYLDPSALVPDYDQDYTWMSLPGHGGTFTSELYGETWMQSIQQSLEDKTFYRLPNLYSEGTAFYFYLDTEQNSVSILKGQKSGLETFGNPICIEGTPGKSSYDAQSGTLTLGLTLYLADENGKKAAELKRVVETIQLGTETEALMTGKSIDDYVGNWIIGIDGAQSGRTLASISKVDEKTLAVNGLSITGADDTVLLDYDRESGLLSFQAQEVPSLSAVVGVPVLIVPFNSVLSSLTDQESFLGGLTADGELKFVNSASNKNIWDSMCFICLEEDNVSILTGCWNNIEWAPYTVNAATNAAKAQLNRSKIAVSREVMPKRTYKTELNLRPMPAETRSSMEMELLVPMNKGTGLLEITR